MHPEDNVVAIPLHARNGEVRAFAYVDQRDEAFAAVAWHLTSGGYVARTLHKPRRTTYLHREIAGVPGYQVDHVDGDPLNNRRANLRTVTVRQNAHNVPSRGGYSVHRGVQYSKRDDTWWGQVRTPSGLHITPHVRTEAEALEAVIALRQTLMTHANEARSVWRPKDRA